MALPSPLDRIPSWMATPLSVAASLGATVATGLLLLAAIHGDPVPAVWGGGLFGVAGLLWQAADRTTTA